VEVIWKTVELAITQQVTIGAHVSFLDRENFGRKEWQLEPEAIYDLVTQQLLLLNDIAIALGAKMEYVKPHGALYNMSAQDAALAKTIAQAVKDFDSQLQLIGLSGSTSISAAQALGITTQSEVFADRSYQDDGSLTPRSQPNALLTDSKLVCDQVAAMITKGEVTTVNGKIIPIKADTICLHGDGEQAVVFAKAIHQLLHEQLKTD